MSNNDQLSKPERLRLECFAQAVNSSFSIEIEPDQRRPSIDDLFVHAKKIEAFLLDANPKMN